MTGVWAAVLATALTSSAAFASGDGGASSTFFCNMRALKGERREQQTALTQRLFGSVLERRELPSGYELRLDPAKVSIVDLARWVDGEQSCCPFLALAIEKEPRNGPLWLRLTGPAGVKDFLLAEMDVSAR